MKLTPEQRAELRRRRARLAKIRENPKPVYTGPNRGRVTPAAVLAFIEARLQESEHEPDVGALAREMGYDEVAIHKLKEKHGDKLFRHLQTVRRRLADTDRFLAKQQGQSSPEQYVANVHGAMDELPAIPRHYEDDLPLQNARKLYDAMVEAELAMEQALERAEGSPFVGELRRSHAQAKRARERAEQALTIHEREKARNAA